MTLAAFLSAPRATRVALLAVVAGNLCVGVSTPGDALDFVAMTTLIAAVTLGKTLLARATGIVVRLVSWRRQAKRLLSASGCSIGLLFLLSAAWALQLSWRLLSSLGRESSASAQAKPAWGGAGIQSRLGSGLRWLRQATLRLMSGKHGQFGISFETVFLAQVTNPQVKRFVLHLYLL